MRSILFIDSGMGGATIVKQIKQQCPQENLIFYVENKFAPLGNLTKRQLTSLAIQIIKRQNKHNNLKMVVFACNTLTCACLKEVKKAFPKMKIIGVYPNIKVEKGKTIVIATRYTIKNSPFLKNKKFTLVELPQLSLLIDVNYPNLSLVKPYLVDKLSTCKNYKNLVLGCTHYILAKQEIQEVLHVSNIYDSLESVTNRIKMQLKTLNKGNGSLKIILSKNNSALKQKIKEFINQQ